MSLYLTYRVSIQKKVVIAIQKSYETMKEYPKGILLLFRHLII